MSCKDIMKLIEKLDKYDSEKSDGFEKDSSEPEKHRDSSEEEEEPEAVDLIGSAQKKRKNVKTVSERKPRKAKKSTEMLSKKTVKGGIEALEAARPVWREFVQMINKEDFMKKHKGKGKRASQSILFKEFKKMGVDDFKTLLEVISEDIKENKPISTLSYLEGRFPKKTRK